MVQSVLSRDLSIQWGQEVLSEANGGSSEGQDASLLQSNRSSRLFDDVKNITLHTKNRNVRYEIYYMDYSEKYNQILKDFADAWNTLNAEKLLQHLDKSFVYSSQWVFKSLDYDEYKDYLRGKFETLRNNGIKIKADLVYDPIFGGGMIRLIQDGEPILYRIKEKDGKVITGDMCMF